MKDIDVGGDCHIRRGSFSKAASSYMILEQGAQIS